MENLNDAYETGYNEGSSVDQEPSMLYPDNSIEWQEMYIKGFEDGQADKKLTLLNDQPGYPPHIYFDGAKNITIKNCTFRNDEPYKTIILGTEHSGMVIDDNWIKEHNSKGRKKN